MPRKMTVTLYRYDELSDKAKEKARDWFLGSQREFGYVGQIEEDMMERLRWAGVSEATPYFSLSNCQGDGACFVLKQLDLVEFIRCQKLLAERVEKQQWLEWERLRPYRGDRVADDLEVGKPVRIGFNYADLDEQGKPKRNDKGGYTTYHTAGRPDLREQEGQPATGSTTHQELLGLEMDRSDVLLKISHGSAADNPEVLDEWKKLQFNADDLANIQTLLDDEVDLVVSVTHHGNYYHWNSMEVEAESSYYGLAHDALHEKLCDAETEEDAAALNEQIRQHEAKIDEMIKQIRIAFEDWVKDVSRLLEKVGYAEIESQETEEMLVNGIEANDYWFTADGRRSVAVNPDDDTEEADAA